MCIQLELAVFPAGSGHMAGRETTMACGRALLLAGDCPEMPVLAL